MDRSLRRVEWIAILVVLVAILTITFWPTPVDRPFDGRLDRFLIAIHTAGAPGWINYSFVQNGANVLMFVPFGALVASLVMRPLWWTSGLLGLTLSLLIEGSQAVFLVHRFASVGDLVCNTSGALMGGALLAIVPRPDKTPP